MRFLPFLLVFTAVLAFVTDSAQARVIVRTEPITDLLLVPNLDVGLELGELVALGIDYSHGIMKNSRHESTKAYAQIFTHGTRSDSPYGKIYVGSSKDQLHFQGHTLFGFDDGQAIGLLAGYQWVFESGILLAIGAGIQHFDPKHGSASILPAFEISIGYGL